MASPEKSEPLPEPDKPAAGESESPEEILRVARHRFSVAVEAEIEHRKVSKEDMDFRTGDQWPLDIKAARNNEQRPCLTVNRMPQFVHQITNDARQNRPAIKISPMDSAATLDTADVIQGMVRHIESISNADIAYDRALEAAVERGRGFYRVVTDYLDHLSFNQEIFIRSIKDPNSVYCDPHYQEPDGSDMNWAFVFDDLSKDEFKSLYPKAELSRMSDWTSLGDATENWVSTDTVRVAEYFYKTFKKATICLLSDGSVIDKADLKKVPVGTTCVTERETTLPEIKWCKHNGMEILEETAWPGKFIPIIPVHGSEIYHDGNRIFEGIIRHAKDPQRMLNYWTSAETEAIALAPKAPFIVAEGQIEGHEDIWKTANTKSHPYLPYKQTSLLGIQAPPPQRNAFEPAVMAITQARAQSADDLKSTTGMYDASLGNRSNENSGVAIQRRTAQSQTGNFHYTDNLTRSLRQGGRIIIDLLPHVYDTPRAVRCLGEDGKAKIVAVNQVFEEKGQEKIHQLDIGQYDVSVTAGPSFATKRQEATAAMTDLAKAFPPLLQTAGDLMVRNMDWPGADQIADRMKKMLPPQLQDEDENKPQVPPELQQKMQQQGQMIDQLTKELHQSQDMLDQKKLELESRERIAIINAETTLKVAALKTGSQESIVAFEQELQHLQKRMELIHNAYPIGAPDQPDTESSNALPPQGAGDEPQNQPTGGPSPGQPVE